MRGWPGDPDLEIAPLDSKESLGLHQKTKKTMTSWSSRNAKKPNLCLCSKHKKNYWSQNPFKLQFKWVFLQYLTLCKWPTFGYRRRRTRTQFCFLWYPYFLFLTPKLSPTPRLTNTGNWALIKDESVHDGFPNGKWRMQGTISQPRKMAAQAPGADADADADAQSPGAVCPCHTWSRSAQLPVLCLTSADPSHSFSSTVTHLDW